MQLPFSELYKDTILESQILIICGQHTTFNKIAVDRLKNKCKIECFKQLGIPLNSDQMTLQSLGNAIDFDTFMSYHSVPPFIGRWFCYADVGTLTQKQLEFVFAYLQSPSKYGTLVLEATSYMQYKEFLSNRLLKTEKYCHVLKLSYPNKSVLKEIILNQLQGINIADKALDLFILRMGEAYDEYQIVLDRIKSLNLTTISYDDMKKALTGIEHYNTEDFLRVVLKPPRTAKSSKKKALNMMYVLIGDMGAHALLTSISNSINQLLELRTYVNKGYIPGTVKFDLDEFKAKLDDTSYFKKMNNYSLGKKLNLAFMTSQRDLLFMKMIIMQGLVDDCNTCEKTLYVLLTRALLVSEQLSQYLTYKELDLDLLPQVNSIFSTS